MTPEQIHIIGEITEVLAKNELTPNRLDLTATYYGSYGILVTEYDEENGCEYSTIKELFYMSATRPYKGVARIDIILDKNNLLLLKDGVVETFRRLFKALK